MEILNDFGIDPYEFLGVSVTSTREQVKAEYKKKAKMLHPDKTGGKTEAQFKLLHISYKYIIKNCVDVEIATHEQLKNTPREEVGYARTYHNTNFDDPETRKDLFVDDDLDLEQFQEHMNRVNGLSTTYSAENFYKKEVLDTMKSKGKFDVDKFNAFFIKLQKDGKIENQLIVKEKVVPSNLDRQYVNVNIFDGMLINSIDKGDKNYQKLLKQKSIKNDDITELIDTDTDVINGLIREHKKNTGAMSKKELKKLQKKASVNVPVNTSLSFEQAKENMLLEQINQMKISQKEQMEYVTKNKRIFANRLNYR
jgi:hypothetical protein